MRDQEERDMRATEGRRPQMSQSEETERKTRIMIRRRLDACLTTMMLNAVDRQLSKTERTFWRKQAWMLAKRIKGGGYT